MVSVGADFISVLISKFILVIKRAEMDSALHLSAIERPQNIINFNYK